MSPPPRHEAEDYLNSHALHGGRKKHHARPAAVSRFSEPVADTQALQSVAVEQRHDGVPLDSTSSTKNAGLIAGAADSSKPKLSERDNQTQQPQGWSPSPRITTVSDDQTCLDDIEQQSANLPAGTDESFAVLSLRRLSHHGHQSANEPSHTDKSWQPLRGMLETMFAPSTATSRKRSIDDDATPHHQSLTRRSTAFREGDRRRPRKSEIAAATLGLEIPATITLRKATGLFQLGPGSRSPVGTGIEESVDAREGSISPPRACTLMGFDSSRAKNAETAEGEEENSLRRSSTVPTQVHELLAATTEQGGSGKIDTRRQSLAETAVTVAQIFPSSAILTCPTKVSPPAVEMEARISVVQVKSRNSLHQIIWREDDTWSSSGISSVSLSPTRSTSAKRSEASDNSPVLRSITNSKANTPQSSSSTLNKEQNLALDPHSAAEESVPFNTAQARPEGQMLQWSWGVAEDAPYDPMDSSDAAKASHGPPEKRKSATADRSFGVSSPLPQLFVPDEAEAAAAARHPSRGISRRGSFAIDSASLASMTPEREAGNRRSISVSPLMLARLGDGRARDSRLGGHTSRRFSRV